MGNKNCFIYEFTIQMCMNLLRGVGAILPALFLLLETLKIVSSEEVK